jgi:hypothetical protein
VLDSKIRNENNNKLIENFCTVFANVYFDKKIGKTPFYKRYNYSGVLPLASVDKRGVFDSELNIFYNRIPKAGSSTIIANLYSMKYGINIASLTDSRRAKYSFKKPSEMLNEEVDKISNYFKFTIVRNPYTRILSAYQDKISSGKKNLKNSFFADEIPSFSEFCRYLELGGWKDNIHWAPQTSILLLPLKEYNYIGYVESLAEDLTNILEKISNNYIKDILNFTQHKTGADDIYRQIYDSQSVAIVAKIYQPDFDAFGYNPDYFCLDYQITANRR